MENKTATRIRVGIDGIFYLLAGPHPRSLMPCPQRLNARCGRAWPQALEIEPRRQLNHARRPCRVGDADRRAEGRVVVNLRAELQRAAADANVLIPEIRTQEFGGQRRASPVASLTSVTVAPGSTCPDASTTVPETVPVSCAVAGRAAGSSIIRIAARIRVTRFIHMLATAVRRL